jgi:hypothetical protein
VPGKDFVSDVQAAPVPPVNWQGLLGYLNYAEGRPDPRFQGQLHAACVLAAEQSRGQDVVVRLADLLDEQLGVLQQQGVAAFRETDQARVVIRAALRELPRVYRKHHADLLAGASDADLFTPFFLARACEAVLTVRSGNGRDPADAARLAGDAVLRLNDFVGYRPVPMLENRPAGEVYEHERFRPVPLYLRGVGVAAGPYQELVRKALEIVAATDTDLLDEGQFDPSLLDELALDPRPYDHNHPANRRPNHVFGEWDPHHLDNQGRHRRFVVRKDTIDGLLAWIGQAKDRPHEEAVFDAAAVMAGTMLMASALCGRGPNSHDSGATLATIVPQIAKLRDLYYDRLLTRTGGERGRRLRQDSEAYRQPLGGPRQYLNLVLARQRALQLQERFLALLFAALGYPGESRKRSKAIATASVRLGAEARSQITSAALFNDRGEPEMAAEHLAQAEAAIQRGIACGALADPWTLLGFQGLYPLFQAREDAMHDPRVDELLELLGDLFGGYAQAIGEAAAGNRGETRERLTARMQALATWWDQFAGFEVGELPRVNGGEATAAAEHVAEALTRWRERISKPDAGSDLAFWREHLDGFRTPAAFARVVGALLDRGDRPAAMGLLVAWLGESPGVPLEDGDHSFHTLIRRWIEELCSETESADRPKLLRRFFEALEANAEEFWHVPSLGGATATDGADDVFEAAYEGVTFRDSADDGTEGAVLGDASPGGEFPLEHDTDRLADRLQFLATVADLWRIAARCLPAGSPTVNGCLRTALENRGRLNELLDQLHTLKVPEPPTGFEGAVEYDRRRAQKEHVTEEAITAAVSTERAIRGLRSLVATTDQGGDDWAPLAVEVERHLARADSTTAAAVLKQLLTRLRDEPLLYVPLSAGGHPRQILRARSVQGLLHDLMGQLPRLGLLRETFAVVQTARAMEQASPPEGRKVTEFDRLFPVALQATVNAVLDVAESLTDDELQAALKRVTDPYLLLWVEHSQTLRLSVLESTPSAVERESLRGFIQRYGRELFTAAFLNLASVRSVLHRGVSAWLDDLPRQDDPPEKFLDELDAKLPRAQAVRMLETVLQAVVENYEEYRDYNTTTTQSDYGENLYILLDFLRLKAAYERDNWRMRPLVQVHEVLCRRDRVAAAAEWENEIAAYTGERADRHLAELGELESRHHVKLRTARDRLSERFVAPLAVDRMCALVGPARATDNPPAASEAAAFGRLAAEIGRFAATPAGVGLEVPHWLRRLHAELERLKQEPNRGPGTPSRLTAERLREEMDRDWTGRLEDSRREPPKLGGVDSGNTP